jgi:hypothetical protein
VLGRWLAGRPGVRDRVKISTKVGAAPAQPSGPIEGLSAGAVKNKIQGSLRRLGTDRVDLYWAHLPDAATPLEETVAALDEVVSAGQAGRLGCSDYPVWQLEQARQIARDSGRGRYTRADKPLPDGYDHPGTSRRLAMLDEIAADRHEPQPGGAGMACRRQPGRHPDRRRQLGRPVDRRDRGSVPRPDP